MNSVSETATAVMEQPRPRPARVSAQAGASFLLLVLLGMLSKGVGLLREMALAAQFGTSGAMDAYLVAQTLPSAVLRVFDELLGASLLPLFAGWCVAASEAAAWARLKGLLRFLLWASALLVVVTLPLAGLLVRALAPGLGGAEAAIAARALVILLPGIAFGVAGSIFAALLNYHRRFVCAALFALLGNALALLSILLLARRIGIYSAAAGLTAGALLLVFQWYFLPAAGRREPLAAEAAATRAEFWRLAGPLAAGIALFNIAPLVQNFLASLQPEGSIALLNYAFKVDWLAYIVLVVPITTLAFPRLADAGAAGDSEKFLGALHLALKAAWLALLPAMIVLGVAGDAVIALLFQRGNFTAAHTAEAASILRVFLLGLPGAAATLILFYALYALKHSAARLNAGILVFAIYSSLGWMLSRLWGVRGLALTLGITFTALTLLLGISLGRVLDRAWWRPLWSFVARAAAAAAMSALMLSALWTAAQHLPLQTSAAGRLIVLTASAATATGGFVFFCSRLGISEVSSLLQQVRALWPAPGNLPTGGSR